jgi:hypothetical protein
VVSVRLGPVAALLLVHAAVVLGGMYLMLTAFGDELDRRLDHQVSGVLRDVERDLDRVQAAVLRQLRRELAARLPPAGQP